MYKQNLILCLKDVGNDKIGNRLYRRLVAGSRA